MSTIGIICKKRLIGDIKLLKKDPHEYIDVSPDENDILTWYFLIKGPNNSDYKGGYFIGKLMHNPEYPLKPPDFMMLTPSGRFEIGKKICLSNTGYHSNEWSAMWTVHATLTGFLSIMLDDKEDGISHIHESKNLKEFYSQDSVEYNKKHHKELIKKFTRFLDDNGDPIKEPVTEQSKEPVTEQIKEPVTEQTKEPVTKSVLEPLKESIKSKYKPLKNKKYAKTDREYMKIKKSGIKNNI